MISNKPVVQRLLGLFAARGIDQVVVSPGSRNAPLIQTFSGRGDFKMYSVPDERTAGFFALGIAMKNRRPVILNCTSGSALLHFGPAIVEAYYQNIPLIVLSADRPAHLIDQGHGQSIRQENVFSNYVKGSLNRDEDSYRESWYFDMKVNEILQHTVGEDEGPVHINIHLDEPLYDFEDFKPIKVRTIHFPVLQKSMTPDTTARLQRVWNESERVMILVGQHPPRTMLNAWLEHFATRKKVVILAEHTSNVHGNYFRIDHIDRCIFPMDATEWKTYQPDLLITFGKEIVSKKIKKLLLESTGVQHWHVGKNADYRDTFGSLTEIIQIPPHQFLMSISEFRKKPSTFRQLWEQRSRSARETHDQFLTTAAWSDLKAWEFVAQNLPSGLILHLGNSASIRYSLLFSIPENIECYSNRGVSGIDGCTSTALGFATQQPDRDVWLICGDVSFLYDRNAFWQTPRPSNFKVIVVNNGGGGIFRFIEGPQKSRISDPFLETPHTESVLPAISGTGIHSFSVDTFDDLQNIFPTFVAASGPTVLEIRTPMEVNDQVLKQYFEHLKLSK